MTNELPFLSRRWLVLVGLLAAAVPAAPASARAAAPPPASASVNQLFVVTAAGGRVERVAGRRGEFKLELRAPARGVTAFSDRPARRLGKRPLAGFVRGWRRLGFGRVPPNAALVIDHAPVGRDVAVFELSSPRLGRGGRTLTFRAKSLARRPTGVLQRLARRADGPAAGRFGRASLFVDSAGESEQVTCVFTFKDLPASGGGGGASFGLGGVTIGYADVQTDAPANTAIFHTAFAVTAFQATPLNATVNVSLDVPVGTTTLKGNATVTGGSATVKVAGGKPQPLNTGPFSIPIPSG
jgi:hypothetical protein